MQGWLQAQKPFGNSTPLRAGCRRRSRSLVTSKAAASAEPKLKAPPTIKVVGVGGSASHAVQQLWDLGPLSNDLGMLLINTDVQELAYAAMPDTNKLLLGTKAANWGSTQGNALIGRAAALERADEIREELQGVDLLVVVAGVGGGTGAGAAPVVAEIARQQGAFTVGIAATPVSHTRRQACSQAVQDLYQAVDALVVLPTHKLLAGMSRPASNAEVYEVTDRLLVAGIQGLAGWLTGSVLTDIDDLRDSMAGGSSWIGHGTAMGPERASCAGIAAVNSPFALADISAASSVLVLVSAPQDSSLQEFSDVASVVGAECGTDTQLILRWSTTPAPTGALSVTVIATHPGPSGTPAEVTAVPAGVKHK